MAKELVFEGVPLFFQNRYQTLWPVLYLTILSKKKVSIKTKLSGQIFVKFYELRKSGMHKTFMCL